MQPENLKIKVPRLGRNRYGVYYVRASTLDPAGRRKVQQLSLRTKDPQLARVLALEFCLNLSGGDLMAGHPLVRRYELDTLNGIARASDPADHARMMEANQALAQAQERQLEILRLQREQQEAERAAREAAEREERALMSDRARQEAFYAKHPEVLERRALALQILDAGIKRSEASPAQDEPAAVAAMATVASGAQLTLAEACDRHLAEERRRVAAQTAHEKQVLLHDFMACFGAETFLNAITKLDISQRWRPAELERPNKKRPDDKVSLARLEKRRGFLSKFFHWASEGGYYTHPNPASMPMAKKAEIRRARRSYAEFTSDDLARLFAPQYVRRMDKPDWYWPPLMALLSGARLSELVELPLDAFEEREGVKLFEIRDGKTKESERVVPLHERLLELGLWDYVQALRARGATHLYPHRSEKYRAKSTGRAWADWVDECAIADKQKTFHSFRSTAITDLHNANAGHAQIRKAVGHAAVGVSGSHGKYIRGIELVNLTTAINQLNPPKVDFALLRRDDPTFSAFFDAQDVKARTKDARAQSQARHELAARQRAERNARAAKR